MARKRSRQLGGNTPTSEITRIVQEETSRLKREGKWEPVGSPLLHGLLGRSRADVAAIAAREWAEVTGGAGVVLVDGKPVGVKGVIPSSCGGHTPDVDGQRCETSPMKARTPRRTGPGVSNQTETEMELRNG